MSEECSPSITAPVNFEQLAAARREWIESVLRVWCRQATFKELRKAEQEWFDIAGRADVNPTLWTWAWERFPDTVHPELPGVHETFEVRVTLNDGQQIVEPGLQLLKRNDASARGPESKRGCAGVP